MAKRVLTKMKRKTSTKSKLIKKFLEHEERTNYVKVLGRKDRGRGIYFLYKGNNIYYIGLSVRSLRARISRHAKRDRHSKLDKHGHLKWNNFSFYQIGRTKFINDVESLFLRVVSPPGNERSGRFKEKYDLAKK